ncbi:PFU-domain-containing protein [Ascodesmis nigricans]|uniref:PFU-domain-containing protein n=1 Tax=Ascodesmis nigricans TaxID=341454 RepID=A0A4S2MZL4_9PEZI|nr:PFU-domain-containing protein [Ascodesmis nigricans]
MSPPLYKLSASLQGHEDDVRGVVFPSAGSVISASRDSTVRVWRASTNSTDYSDHINSTGSAFINAVTYVPPSTKYPEGLIVSGGQETIIEVRQPGTTATDAEFLLLGHAHNVCTLDAYGDIIVSGSWDGTARVWRNWETQHVLEGHEGAVWAVLALSETEIVTGGADKTIRLWKDGKQVAVLGGHTDCVRGLCRLPNGLFASCANDATIRIWSRVGHQLQELHGHTNYIYSIAALPTGEIVSSGEDRTVRVWKDGACVQTITHPAISVWSVAACSENGDIVSGASDRIVRVFSREQKRWASPEALTAFDESVKASAIPANQIGDIQKDKLPGQEALQQPGKKDGQVIMVRNGQNVEAYTWSNAERTWVNVGTVVDAVGSNQKKLYNGKEYDFVFDVDIQEGQPPLKLPYNASENPFDAARRFLENNELPISYLDTVGNFIVQNSQGVSLGGGQSTGGAPDPWGSDNRYRPGDSNANPAPTPSAPPRPRFLPHSEYLTIATSNLTTVEKKFNEFNQELVDGDRKDVALNPDDMSTISELIAFLQKTQKPPAGTTPEAVSRGLELLVQVISTWPVPKRLPALDLLRVLAASSPVVPEFKTGHKNILSVITSSVSVSPEHANNAMLVVRAFVNMFQTNSGKEFVDQNHSEILRIVKNVAKDTTNRNLKIAEATLLLNFAVLFRTKNESKKALSTLDRITTLINSETDAETAFRNLMAMGTLMTMGGEVKETAVTTYKAESAAKAAAARIQDVRISQISEDFGRVVGAC